MKRNDANGGRRLYEEKDLLAPSALEASWLGPLCQEETVDISGVAGGHRRLRVLRQADGLLARAFAGGSRHDVYRGLAVFPV